MSQICPNCGYDELTDGTDWCPRCNEFLAWGNHTGEDTASAEAASAEAAGAGESTTVATRPAVQTAPSKGRVVLRLRTAADEIPTDDPVDMRVEAGQTATVTAIVRNETEIVEHFRISVVGLPASWWSVEEDEVRLLPFGSGDYETELMVSIHPPRTARTPAGHRDFEIVATAVAQPLEARVPATVDVLPFQALALVARPRVVTGRRRASVVAVVSNIGNAPVAVDVDASELEDRCRFFLPDLSTGILPGQVAEIPIGVRPRKPIILGRKADRLLELRAWTAGDEPGPPVTAPATFRQRPLIPWWVALIVLLLLIAALLVFLLWPRHTKVPDVRGLPSAFAAQQRLEKKGLSASPDTKTAVRTDVKPGTVIGQAPAPGTKVDHGRVVNLLLARGKRKTRVPNVVGLTPVQADQHLVGAHLTLGAVAPELDPKAKIASQVPASGRRRAWGTPVEVVLAGATVEVPKVVGLKAAKADQRLAKAGLKLGKMNPQPDAKLPIVTQIPSAGAHRPAGTPVDVFLKQPKARGNKKKKQSKKKGGAKAKATSVPATGGVGPVAAAAAMESAGLQPRTTLAINDAAPGTVLRTLPSAGAATPSDGVVRIVVSAGFPRLAYDIGTAVFTADGAAGGAAEIMSHAVRQAAPSWIPGGRAVVARSDGALVITQTLAPHNPVRLALGRAGNDLDQPAVAGDAERAVLAFVSHRADNGDLLCLSRLSGAKASRPSCRRLAGWRLGEITWMPNGRRLLVAANRIDSADWRFGLLRLTSDTRLSTDARAWRGGRSLVTPSQPGHGVLTVAPAPSGRQLAVVTNNPTGRFQIAIARAGDLALKHARVLPVQGCDVAWRPDGAELAVVQSDNKCAEPVGRIVRVAPSRPRTLSTVVLRGRDPAWQPVALGAVSLARASALGTPP